MSVRKRTPNAMWRCASWGPLLQPTTKRASHVLEALDEARQRLLLLVVLDDEVLPGERERPLDDHVVEGDRLDQELGVLRLGRQAVDPALQHPVEQLAERVVQVLLGRAEAPGEVGGLEDAHLLV